MSTTLTVTQLASLLKENLETVFARVSVVGELTGVSRPASGHLYFTLKDAQNNVACVMWKSSLARVKFQPQNGQEVVVRGRVTFYGGQGKCQISADCIEPVGVGAAELAKRQLLEKLRGRGYFDTDRKRPLPAFPQRVAIVSSATGAVVRDMLELLSQRWPLCEAVVVHSRVQGDGAAAELAIALTELGKLVDERALQLDAVIVGRGGGSAEDLAAFDDERVATAIFDCPVPVIAAVGHETDVSIADLVADVRAETPSAAIMRLVPNRAELMTQLEAVPGRLRESLRVKLLNAKRRLDLIAGRPAFTRPGDRIRQFEQRLDTLSERLNAAMQRRVTSQQARLQALAERLESLSPLAVLTRGYSVTRREDGSVVKDASQVVAGTLLTTRLAKGEVRSRVV